MKWLKRGLWLAAWGVWFWLGFGLYRELPREVGPAVCQLVLSPRRWIVGFDGPSRVVVAEFDEAGPTTVAVFDAENGACVARFPAPALEQRLAWRGAVLHHGHYVNGNYVNHERESGGLQALNLADGVCHSISPRGAIGFTVHPTKPLVAFVDSVKGPSGRRLAFYDLKEHRLMFETELTTEGRQVDAPIFISGTDKIVVMTRTNHERSPDGRTTLLVCTMPTPDNKPKVEMFDVGLTVRGWATTSGTGRAAFGPGDSGAFEVFDFKQGRVVFSRPTTEKGSAIAPVGATHNPPAMSATGRTVLGDWPQTLWDVDSRVPHWRARSFDFAFPDFRRVAPESVGTRFLVLEQWSELWKNWLPNLRFTTLAHRDASDGSFLYRLSQRDRVADGSYNADWSLVVADDGSVYRLTPGANWPLLALCQTILALPLVLLWATLRWRRRIMESRAE
jgi:hypothetical protein